MAAPSAQPIPRRLQSKVSPLRAGIMAMVLIVIATYLAFSKQLPWEQPFEFKATFETSNILRLDSPVRIAGVNVGKVTEVERAEDSDMVEVTMTMDDAGLPVHKDATAMIRSRIFLEGNFFVDLKPGTPEAGDVDDGDTIPVTQTSTPVQLDELLTALQTDDREALRGAAPGSRQGLLGQADRGIRLRPGQDRARRDRGPVAERLAERRPQVPEDVGPGQPGTARHGAARPLQADQGTRQGRHRARHQRGAAEGLHHQLQRLLRGVRRGAGQPEPARCTSSARRWSRRAPR